MPVCDSNIIVKLWCLVAGREELLLIECPPEEGLGALLSRVAPESGPDPHAPLPGRKCWIVATADGRWYAQGPFACSSRVDAIANGAREIELFLAHTDVCRHGSPGVRRHGFLCGWC